MEDYERAEDERAPNEKDKAGARERLTEKFMNMWAHQAYKSLTEFEKAIGSKLVEEAISADLGDGRQIIIGVTTKEEQI